MFKQHNVTLGYKKLQEGVVPGNPFSANENKEGFTRIRGKVSPKVCEKARAWSSCEMTKDGKVVTETGGVDQVVPLPEIGGAQEDGWLDSNMVDTVVSQTPCTMRHLKQKNERKTLSRKLWFMLNMEGL